MPDRTILFMSAPIGDKCVAALPLCDASALALSTALAHKDQSMCAAELRGVLSVDPAAAIWSACCAGAANWAEGDLQKSLSVASLSDWLAADLGQWLNRFPPGEAICTEQQHAQFAALVAESIGGAHEVVRAARREDFLSDPNFLASLTARRADWLGVLRQNEDAVSAPWPLASPPAPAALGAESCRAGDAAWRRWLAAIPGVQTLLPSLVARWGEWNELTSGFESRLQTAKLDAMKEFAYGAGHELNNPLANIASRAQTLLEDETHPERRRRLAAINAQAFRAHEMLADVMFFARPPQLVPSPFDVVQLANEVLAELSERAAEQGTTLRGPECEEDIAIRADRVQLAVALGALYVNSLEAIGEGGEIKVDVRCARQGGGSGGIL